MPISDFKSTKTSKKKRIRVDPSEPNWESINPDSPSYDSEKAYALGWMSAEFTSQQLKDSTVKYSDIKNLSNVPHHKFISIGKYFYAMSKGSSFDDSTKQWLDQRVSEICSIHVKVADAAVKKKAFVRQTVQENLRDKISDMIAEVESQFDEFVNGGYKSDFAPYTWLTSLQAKAVHANRISDYYRPILEELKLVGSDADCKQAYSSVSNANVKKLTNFVQMIISDCEKVASNQKVRKKGRKAKTKTKTELTSKLRYLKESTDLKLVSIDPQQIVGSSQLWTYDTRTRALTRYQSTEPGGLSIKGSSIVGFCDKNSASKGTRKMDHVNTVQMGSKVALRKVLNGINTKTSSPTGRSGPNTILLRAVK